MTVQQHWQEEPLNTDNRFALVYSHRNLQLKRVQMSDNFEPFPDSVQVGDFFRGEPIVALAADRDNFACVLADESALCEQGKQRLLTLQPQQQWPYYLVFRFYIVEPQYAATVEEKVAIALLGETQTTRLVGQVEPEGLDTKSVWRTSNSLKRQPEPRSKVDHWTVLKPADTVRLT